MTTEMDLQEKTRMQDEHKEGIRIHPIAQVTKALWFTGDLRGTSISDLVASCQDGENSGIQAPCLAQGQGIGE